LPHQILEGPRPDPIIKPGQVNRLAVLLEGGQAKFYINGAQVSQQEVDSSVSETRIGAQAAVVASIFRMRRRKISYHEIARRLNLQGIPAPNGNLWHGSAVQYIAQNPIYRGKYTYKTERSVREDLKLRAGSQMLLV
jgi:hypothetical protein